LDPGRAQITRWYREVIIAANYTCVLTGQVGGALAAHHIRWYSRHPELRTELSNGVCVHRDLHELFHSLVGRNPPDETAAWEDFCSRYRSGEFEEKVLAA
jgi:hypothetical protein